jgi:creatinine amidohydrolase/Fe(II)-dependent formamide hydrolase-like protein
MAKARTTARGRGRASRAADPLALLEVIDRLEVGPPRIEQRRLSVPYAVVTRRGTERTDLTYRYEEDVFTPGEPASENLAAMIGAQVALNYGLLCSKIVLHGRYDVHDRALLRDAAINTAREIYVKKFLEPNPFLTDVAASLPLVKRDSYLRAELVFPDPPPEAPPRAEAAWSDDPTRHAVLSSGGKDSLLTFGLLQELGLDPQAVFVNESGRHWFTALNAYRYFSTSMAGTSRVWTDSDRLFSFMLRRLPFIRKDFARLRSDEYPVRLWTVAVFLFGALPVLRKRGIGRLVVGDEYDTSIRASHHGIPHYAGLYDQSRWFDNAMTRYFARKEWGVQQFSILRPLSELLILRILVERYPNLQQHQMSCHAAHRDREGRIRPCGRCEKCRRIVGMLEALGADARRCGYTREQIEACLRALAGQGVHQEAAGARQMMRMLVDAGKLPKETVIATTGHPEVLALRFDNVRSPYDAVPNDLRSRLYRIYLEHASGAVERKGRVWAPCDPLSETSLSRPYPFQRPSKPRSPASGARQYLLGELTWPQARARLKEVDVALLPVGAVEQHGPHLPLDTDAYDAHELARRVAEACSDPKPLVLPLVAYGVSYHHEDFSGTLSVSPETQARLVYEIGMSTARNGITKLVIINGHGGNAPSLHLAAQMINKDAHIFTCVDTGETSDADIEGIIVDAPNDVHAGEIETSTVLATRPSLVDMSKAPKMVPRFSSRFLDFTSKRSVGWYAHTSKISNSGVMGNATKATAEKGERIWEVMTRRLTELVEDLKRLSLEEIYQKRY